MLGFYILDGHLARPCANITEWAEWMATHDCRVASTDVGNVWISTVFLGLNHNYRDEGDPLLFETMVFIGGESTGEQFRYFIWAEAEAGHARIVADVKARNKVIEGLQSVDSATVEKEDNHD